MVIVAESSNREDLALIFLSITYCYYMSLKGCKKTVQSFCTRNIDGFSISLYLRNFLHFSGENGWDGDCNFLCSSCMNPCPRRCCLWWLLMPNHHTRRMSTRYHQSQYLNTCARKGLAHLNMGFLLRVGFYSNILILDFALKGLSAAATALQWWFRHKPHKVHYENSKPPNSSWYLTRSSKFGFQYIWSHSMVINDLMSFTSTVYHVCHWFLFGNTGRWPSRCGVYHRECDCHGIPTQWFKLWTSRLCRGTAPNWLHPTLQSGKLMIRSSTDLNWLLFTNWVMKETGDVILWEWQLQGCCCPHPLVL